jgi:hypothetical protein
MAIETKLLTFTVCFSSLDVTACLTDVVFRGVALPVKGTPGYSRAPDLGEMMIP